MADITNTSRVILGVLRAGEEMTGYEIKAFVDDSTEFFWPASYGRIYPELRRLEADGLITSRDEPRGQRPRKVYALTPEGVEALETWLGSADDLLFEVRDEGMLKFFFSDFMPRDRALANLRAMEAHHERVLARMRELEPFVQEIDPLRFPGPTLEFGIELHSMFAGWCRRTREDLSGSA